MVAEVLAAAGCVAALVVTALTQVRKPGFVRWLKRHDTFALIPIWTFFAPNPGTSDTRILWRERLFDGTISPWHEIAPPTGGLRRAFWNPDKRVRKAITDVGPGLARRARKQPDSKLVLVSVPFLMVLQYISALPGSPLAESRQFTVVQTSGADDEDGEPRILLVSNWHALRQEDEAKPTPDGEATAEVSATR